MAGQGMRRAPRRGTMRVSCISEAMGDEEAAMARRRRIFITGPAGAIVDAEAAARRGDRDGQEAVRMSAASARAEGTCGHERELARVHACSPPIDSLGDRISVLDASIGDEKAPLCVPD